MAENIHEVPSDTLIAELESCRKSTFERRLDLVADKGGQPPKVIRRRTAAILTELTRRAHAANVK